MRAVCSEEARMHSRTALPLLLLLASACAQVPSGTSESALDERAAAAQAASRASAAAAEAAASAAAAAAAAAAPKLQPAEQLATPAVQAVEPPQPSKSLWPRVTRG